MATRSRSSRVTDAIFSGKAAPATAGNLENFEARRAEYEAKANQQLGAAEARKARFDAADAVTIKANSSTEGKLFGSVGPRDIADAFTAAGLALDKNEVIQGEGPIRHIGEFEVRVHLHADIHSMVKVIVVPEK